MPKSEELRTAYASVPNRPLLPEEGSAEHQFPFTEPLSERPHNYEEETVPTVFTWNQGGHEVYITGSFNKWKEKIPMRKSMGEFTIIKVEYLYDIVECQLSSKEPSTWSSSIQIYHISAVAIYGLSH